ncbi:helix-turn-helix transcriptional regulator [Herbiconiux solani]|uniref:helix-turn-helix transcriptional regulator n=1 Tax=Herbiconiux solani TaxID=661329 RepID=UPI000A006749|nr:WYL domain-containing protein [Herbiconiux solani]
MSTTASRILSLLDLLQTHRQWAGPELARRLEVTERTLRRDIERLRELGYHVTASRGSAGGYRLEAGSELPPLLLSDEEAVTMAIGLRLAAMQGVVDGERTTLGALAKFEQVLPAELRRRVNALAGHVQPEGPRPGAWNTGSPPPPVPQELLGALALACRDHERVRLHYTAADGSETDRQVEPHTLVASGQVWFLVCWDLGRDAWRTLRVDRMSRLTGTRVRAHPRALPADDAAAFVRTAVEGLRRRRTAEVHLRLPLAAMRERFGRYGDDAWSLDADTTVWPIHGETVAALAAWLPWIPADLEYTLHGDDELLAHVRATAARMRDASAAGGSAGAGARADAGAKPGAGASRGGGASSGAGTTASTGAANSPVAPGAD